jgi:hypothetical protein
LAQETNTELRSVKATIARVKEQKDGFVAPAKQIIANAHALFDPAIQALVAAEMHLKGQLTAYTEREDKRLEDARRAREAEERAARQKAAEDAAAVLARAEQEAQQRAREAAEAEARRKAAEDAGNDRAAKAAAAEKAKAEEQARAAIENGAAKAAEATLAASAFPANAVVPERVKIDGYSTRENFVAELDTGCTEDIAKDRIVAAIAAGRTDLRPLLALDMVAANRLAKALKGSMNVPGLRAVDRPVGTSRKK